MTLPDPEGIAWLHAMPKERPVDREDFLTDLVRGKRVVHLGFVDYPLLERRIATGAWLHARLAKAADELVGIDVDADGVAWAREHGFDAYVADVTSAADFDALQLERADVVVAGEVIEHVDAPGPMLRAIRRVCRDDGILAITAPNAYSIASTVSAWTGRELIHPDHVVVGYSPNTLRVLLERSGWTPHRLLYYQNPSFALEGGRKTAKLAANIVRKVATRYASDGVIALARQRP